MLYKTVDIKHNPQDEIKILLVINTQKSLTFLYTNNEKTKREIKGKNLIHHCNVKNKILRNKFT